MTKPRKYDIEIAEVAREGLPAIQKSLTLSEQDAVNRRIIHLYINPYDSATEMPEGYFALEEGRVLLIITIDEEEKLVSLLHIELQEFPVRESRRKMVLRWISTIGLAVGVLGGILKVVEGLVALASGGGAA